MAENYISQYYSWNTGDTMTSARLNGNISNLISGLSGGVKALNAGKLLLNSVERLDSSGNATLANMTTTYFSGWHNPTAIIPTMTSAADAPNYEITFAGADLTSYITVGDKFRCTQNGATVYGIVHKAAYAGGNTVLQLYCGTDYTVGDTGTYPITAVFFSKMKSPEGFPTSPAKWTITVSQAGQYTKGDGSDNTWYEVSTDFRTTLPIGDWEGDAKGELYAVGAGESTAWAIVAFSDANNSKSGGYGEYTTSASAIGATSVYSGTGINIPLRVVTTAKTVFYLVWNRVIGTSMSINRDSAVPTVIKLTSAYL
jgi:hypothetical protein